MMRRARIFFTSTLLVVSVFAAFTTGGAQNSNNQQTTNSPTPSPTSRSADSTQAGASEVSDPKQVKLNAEKLEEEVRKLKEEARALEISNEALGASSRFWTAWLPVLSAVGGSLFTLFLLYAGISLNQTQKSKLAQDKELDFKKHQLETRKLEQDKALEREKHMLEVFKELGNTEERVRIGGVAVLVQRLKKIRDLGDKAGDDEQKEFPTIVSVLISVTKHEGKVEIQKYIADGIAGALDAIMPEGQAPDTTKPSPLSEFDFQGAQLNNAWWFRVDARGVDFYKASLADAGLREAFLSGAVLKYANLAGSTLVGAKLDRAQLQSAKLIRANLGDKPQFGKTTPTPVNLAGADLSKADLTGANLSGANLTGAQFDGANLRGATFDRAIIKGTKFGRANVTGVDFSLAVADSETDFSRTVDDSLASPVESSPPGASI